MSYNPYDNVLATVENAAHILGYKPAEYEAVKYPERELSVSVPVRMDDGSVKVFKGYRVQHSTVRGPAKGGIRYHQNVNLDEVKALSAWMTFNALLPIFPTAEARAALLLTRQLFQTAKSKGSQGASPL